MTVYVLVSDCGLNGPWVHGVYTEPPGADLVQEFVNKPQTAADGFHYCVASTTGYQNTEIVPFELDQPPK